MFKGEGEEHVVWIFPWNDADMKASATHSRSRAHPVASKKNVATDHVYDVRTIPDWEVTSSADAFLVFCYVNDC